MLKRILQISVFFILSLFFISCSSIKRPDVVKQHNHYQITHVNVVDVINKKIKYDARVEVKDGRIVAVNSSRQVNLNNPDNQIKTIDGKGKYLIPGLWDNHTTLLNFSPELDFPLYIANGVTSIRSNLSCPNENKTSVYACQNEKARWKHQIAKNELIGPSIHGWGTFPINGKKKHPDSPDFHGARTPEDAKKVVDYYAEFPTDEKPYFIKTYNNVPKESFLTLAHYARHNGFEIAGHKPREVTIQEAVDAGQRSIAHARLFYYDCSSISEELKAGKHRKRPLTELYPLLIASFDARDCAVKYKYLAKSGAYLNPTLMTRRNDYLAVSNQLEKIQGLEYVHYLISFEWPEDIEKLTRTTQRLIKEGNLTNDEITTLTEKDIKAFKDFYHASAATIGEAQKAGVKILAGTDSWNEYVVPGFSLHEELQALHQAGIDNFSVLQAATINGAEYFKISDEIGSINTGKVADMVLLDANPITDIKNTQMISMVFKGEEIYDQAQINELKSVVKDNAGSHLLTAKMILQLLQNPGGF